MDNDNKTSRFWDNYIAKTISYRVKPTVITWYVKRCEEYIKANSDTKLKYHTSAFVEKYLSVKSRQKQLLDWQFAQIVDALKILFLDIIRSEWAAEFDWEHWHEINGVIINGVRSL